MEKSRAIELLKLAVPIKALTQQEYSDFVEAVNMGMDALEQPDENAQEFIKLTVRYSNGRPYYSIIYLEYDKNGVGHDFVGYSSYSLDVISDYLKKYFMPSAQPEPKEGHWILHESPDGGVQYECSRCGVLWEFNDGTPEDNEAYFCPKCGTKMIGAKHETN